MMYHSFQFADLEPKARMKLTKGSVIPRPIAWISSRNSDGSNNLAPFSYFNMVSSSMLAVSFMRRKGQMKDTPRNLLREGEAVVQIADLDLIAALDLTSAELGVNESEVEVAGLTLMPSDVVDSAGITEAGIRLEVRLDSHKELMDYEEEEVEADLMLLRIVAAHVRDDIFDEEQGCILHEPLNPLARLGGPYYATIRQVEGFERQF